MKRLNTGELKIGLSLSGGGARGLAHIGVLKVLAKAGIPIDLISGTSMGAIIGASYAHGIEAYDLEQIAIKFSHIRQLIRMVDLSGGRRGLLAGNQVRKFLSDILGEDIRFSDLQIPLVVCATDLETGAEQTFKDGNVLDAVMASIAVPGVFAPQPVNHRQFVDGGVKNNLPVDHAHELGADFIIAVDVMNYDFRQLGDPKHAELFALSPTVSFQEIYRYVAMMIAEQTRLRLLLDTPDILITPNLPNDLFAFGGFSRASEAIRSGEDAAKRALPEILTSLDRSNVSHS